MFTPLTIGSLSLPSNIIQGPLAGISCAPFRARFYEFLAPAYCVTEMISAYEVVNTPHRLKRYLYRNPIETKLCYQLSGTEPFVLAEAVKRLEAMGADLIDLNCGCPKLKIRKKGAGSKLVETPEHLEQLVCSMRKATKLPLTVKVRLHPTLPEKDLELAKRLEESGADALIVHGRTYLDDYSVAVQASRIKAIKEVINIPLIANGDVNSEVSFKSLLEESGANGVMCARAGSGRPWLYKQLNEREFKPTLSMQKRAFLAHLEELKELESEFSAFLQAKGLVKYYFRDWCNPTWLDEFYQLSSYSRQQEAANNLYPPA